MVTSVVAGGTPTRRNPTGRYVIAKRHATILATCLNDPMNMLIKNLRGGAGGNGRLYWGSPRNGELDDTKIQDSRCTHTKITKDFSKL
jgi:hypothetical protein